MSPPRFTECDAEDIAPDAPGAQRNDYGQMVMGRRWREALAGLSLDLLSNALDNALGKLMPPDRLTLGGYNQAFHRMLVNG